MSLKFVTGDPLLTGCQTLAIGHNRAGRTETGMLSTALRNAYPAGFATYERRCKMNRQSSGELYLWTQSTPQLIFMTLRESNVGATRLRHVQSCLMTLTRDYRRYHIDTLAIAPLVNRAEWADIQAMLMRWLAQLPLSVFIYETYQAGVQADES